MYISGILSFILGLCSLSDPVSALEKFNGEKFLDGLYTLEEFRGISKRDLRHVERRRLERKKRRLCPYRRERKEFRQMTRREWREFVNAVNAIKQTGEFDRLARIHRGRKRLGKSHGGPNFLGWHRIYLIGLEELLRRVEPCVTIPYWDSTLDYVMKNASWSILFTERFVGNGNGYVRTGPFNNWITGEGDRLTRNIDSTGSLFKDEDIDRMFTQKTHFEITSRSGPWRKTSLENLHGGVHGWVNGQMGILASATEDPVFFMLHAFVDCLWQWWTIKNNITDPYTDYPNMTNGRDPPDDLMDPWAKIPPLAQITNRDGYRPYFEINSCRPRPTCSKARPTCDSYYLLCNVTAEKCVSMPGDWSKTGPPRFDERPPVRKGPKFEPISIDPRVRNDPLPQLLEENNPEASAPPPPPSSRRRGRTRKIISPDMMLP